MRILALAALTLNLLTGNALACREMHAARTCWSNLRVIQGAIEMYELDSNKRMLEPRPALVPSATLKPLVEGGYLQCVPTDPGQGNVTHYAYAPGIGVFCLVHGQVGGKASPRDQLVIAGVNDEALLAEASTEKPDARVPWQPTEESWALLVTAGFLLVEGACVLLSRGRGLGRGIACAAGMCLLAFLATAMTTAFCRPVPIENTLSVAWLMSSLLVTVRRVCFAVLRAIAIRLVPDMTLK
ncbi:MAG: hypothetical protein HY303_06665 [Candidatus Wallbacteria bacterium]|nr:hypothetical protein [Candidatus Wallbacteria bacterium]